MNSLKSFLEHWGVIKPMNVYTKVESACFDTPVNWQDVSDQDPNFPFAATVDGKQWKIRLNDFPQEEYMYTLFVDNKALLSFTDLPSTAKWTGFK